MVPYRDCDQYPEYIDYPDIGQGAVGTEPAGEAATEHVWDSSEAGTAETAEFADVGVVFFKTCSDASFPGCGDSWADIGLQFEPWPWIDPWTRGAPPRCKSASR
jgi:hypothetical protein